MINTIPETASTRTRALPVHSAPAFGYSALGFSALDAQPSCSPLMTVAASRHAADAEINSITAVRPGTAAGLAAVWALDAVFGNAVDGAESTGRKQGRPPRGEPR